mgnify:FL=1
MSKLKNEEIAHQLKDLDDWKYTDNSLTRSYQLDSFMDVMSFANLVSDKSEEINHHPKMIIDYNNITFILATHSEGGVTKLDFDLASFINNIYYELYASI